MVNSKIARRHFWRLAAVSGWLAFILLAIRVGPAAYRRMVAQLPGVIEKEWIQTLEDRKVQIAKVPWRDSRPLHLFAGDSHIELGDWYFLFKGAIAVRNCGLSRATVRDVTELITAVPDRNIETAVLMCGINNLGSPERSSECIPEYRGLLRAVREHLRPKHVLVCSIMPVRQSPVDYRALSINSSVAIANQQLRSLCAEYTAQFIDVTPVIAGAMGGLNPALTDDGLHLNTLGYQKLAAYIDTLLPVEHSQAHTSTSAQ